MSTIPKDLQRLVAEIDGWLELGCNDKAIERLQPLLDRPDARAEGLALRIRAQVATKHHREALGDIAELRRVDYDPEWLDLTEAWCKKRLADLPGAVRCMQQLLERNPRSAIGHFNLGCYLALGGDRERALDEVTVACGIDEKFRELLLDEPDLDSLHRDARFKQLLAPTGDLDASGDDPPAVTGEIDEAFDEPDEDQDEDDFDDVDDEDSDDDDLDEDEDDDDDEAEDEPDRSRRN